MAGYGQPPAATRFKPGQSGNPGGRPRGASLATTIQALLSSPAVEHEQLNSKDATRLKAMYPSITVAELITLVMAKKAATGHIQAADWIARHGFGNRAILAIDPLESTSLASMTAEALDRQARIFEAGQEATGL